jgi:hypothetical protein
MAEIVPFDQATAWRESAPTMRRVVSLSVEKRRELAERYGLTFETAMQKLENDIEEAKRVGQFGPVATFRTMQLKMSALLVERMEVQHDVGIDIWAAIAAARNRTPPPAIDVEAHVVDPFEGA